MSRTRFSLSIANHACLWIQFLRWVHCDCHRVRETLMVILSFHETRCRNARFISRIEINHGSTAQQTSLCLVGWLAKIDASFSRLNYKLPDLPWSPSAIPLHRHSFSAFLSGPSLVLCKYSFYSTRLSVAKSQSCASRFPSSLPSPASLLPRLRQARLEAHPRRVRHRSKIHSLTCCSIN